MERMSFARSKLRFNGSPLPLLHQKTARDIPAEDHRVNGADAGTRQHGFQRCIQE